MKTSLMLGENAFPPPPSDHFGTFSETRAIGTEIIKKQPDSRDVTHNYSLSRTREQRRVTVKFQDLEGETQCTRLDLISHRTAAPTLPFTNSWRSRGRIWWSCWSVCRVVLWWKWKISDYEKCVGGLVCGKQFWTTFLSSVFSYDLILTTLNPFFANMFG